MAATDMPPEFSSDLEAAMRKLDPIEAWVTHERYGDRGVINADVNGRVYTMRCFRRTYVELEHIFGLSSHRIHEIEQAALAKLLAALSEHESRFAH